MGILMSCLTLRDCSFFFLAENSPGMGEVLLCEW